MDDLMGNLQTYELNRHLGLSVKEAKWDKSIALKMAQRDGSEDEDDMVYQTRRFQKIIKKHEGFQKKGTTSRMATANDLCHKCGNPSHFMRDYQSQKQDAQEFKLR
ncbi:uncharacterized protein [Solanum tuberosum]|uniref:uncharacterized protein n=1 Tax=Solanum tuberosum TaxID=4113 RepID=UPI00073A466B|nr:PREDICTED: uncharacterized protein LOC107062506 [Solanum tuberosum]